ncbi:hypothetical protein HGM15179_021281, partial [Zosterops borbonicus]
LTAAAMAEAMKLQKMKLMAMNSLHGSGSQNGTESENEELNSNAVENLLFNLALEALWPHSPSDLGWLFLVALCPSPSSSRIGAGRLSLENQVVWDKSVWIWEKSIPLESQIPSGHESFVICSSSFGSSW